MFDIQRSKRPLRQTAENVSFVCNEIQEKISVMYVAYVYTARMVDLLCLRPYTIYVWQYTLYIRMGSNKRNEISRRLLRNGNAARILTSKEKSVLVHSCTRPIQLRFLCEHFLRLVPVSFYTYTAVDIDPDPNYYDGAVSISRPRILPRKEDNRIASTLP